MFVLLYGSHLMGAQIYFWLNKRNQKTPIKVAHFSSFLKFLSVKAWPFSLFSFVAVSFRSLMGHLTVTKQGSTTRTQLSLNHTATPHKHRRATYYQRQTTTSALCLYYTFSPLVLLSFHVLSRLILLCIERRR